MGDFFTLPVMTGQSGDEFFMGSSREDALT